MQTFTPRLQLVGSSDGRNSRLPNEDSRAVDLEDLNLFDINRFPGYTAGKAAHASPMAGAGRSTARI